jgi:uncharacterized protein YrrD
MKGPFSAVHIAENACQLLPAVHLLGRQTQTGIIEAYDVAGPGFARLVKRHSVLAQSAGVTVGRDALVVSEDAAREFEHPAATN